MQNIKFYALVIALTGILCLSSAISFLTDRVILRSSGQISIPTNTAASGYWEDIRTAVDWVVAQGGIGNVYIPEGTYNFVNVDEDWTGSRVIIPAGINLFGAPTEKDGDGQVIEWKTVLQLPSEVAPPRDNWITMIHFQGHGNPTKPSRVSDIKFVGPREFEPHTQDRWYAPVQMYNVIDFRVDHCFFKNTGGFGVVVRAPADGALCGVIDHCKFINDYGYVEWESWLCSVAYGVMMRRVGTTYWDDNIQNVLGQYTNYTVFIEDCYFSRWRHCACSNDGIHYVFRNNIIEKDSIVGSLDGHGTYDYVGTRAMEIYDNTIIDPIMNKHPQDWNTSIPANGIDGITINWRGGGGVFFNNYNRNYKYGVYMTDEGEVQKCYPHDIWIWNNTWVNFTYPTFVSGQGHYYITENVDYFLRAPNQEQDGFEYTPYTYPHPLTIPQS